ncbi:hypothetical protein MKW92_035111 [Papaver armeniacum]|nr:hypothetical protein MKW92_035111 [Papaver armeniacum]
MAAVLNIFAAAVVILSLVSRAFCQCELPSNIEIFQNPQGVVIHGQPEYDSHVMINCPVFNSVGDLCSLNSRGTPVHYHDFIKFKYASDPSITLTPSSSWINCS